MHVQVTAKEEQISAAAANLRTVVNRGIKQDFTISEGLLFAHSSLYSSSAVYPNVQQVDYYIQESATNMPPTPPPFRFKVLPKKGACPA
jgi:hypothetical protein